MLKKGLLLAFATFGALSLLELTVRITGLAPETSLISVGRFRISDNPLIGYEPVPNYEYHGTALYFFEFRGKSNSLGFRDREHSLEKPPGAYRIVVIGDSITMGLQIDDHTEDVYTNVLESALTRGGRDVEVINFGVSGYNTQQEVHTLADKGIQFKPDLVILAYCINDTEMMNGGIIDVLHGQAKAGKSIDQNQLIPYLHRSALYRFVHSRLLSKQLTRDWDARQQQLGTDTVAESFALLHRLSDEYGFKVVVTVFPAVGFEEARYELPIRLSERERFAYFDLRKSYSQCATREGKVSKDLMASRIHPNKLGHLCAGEAISDFILQERMVDRIGN